MFDKKLIKQEFSSSIQTIVDSETITEDIQVAIDMIIKCFKNNKKIIIFGNGGSAADAQHIAAEFLGRFKKERKSLPAIALNENSSTITAIGNDYSFEKIFSRQCESLTNEGDIAIGISTSGNSENVRLGLITSKKNGAKTIGLLGNNGGVIKNHVDVSITIPSSDTPKIQEVHRIIYHIICKIVEDEIEK